MPDDLHGRLPRATSTSIGARKNTRPVTCHFTIHTTHSDAGSQYTSFAFTAHLLDAAIDASIGTVGDALDNALMESQIGLYKTELIKPRKPWHGLADVELATAEWVDWFNNQRLHTAIGDIPPHEHETNYYAQHQPQPAAGVNA
ncbi:hypothetical protein DI272_42440 [Streptomyces sp. Act143]|nr:hypothetical protein DI272_42440 [Streptomyces sp. Act143]